MGFKLDGEVSVSSISLFGACKSCRSGTKVDAGINREVCVWIDLVHFENILKDHLGHPAFASAKDIGAF